jgi:hypothetical protein
MFRQPVAVGAASDVATSSLLWRYAGQLHLSVAIQARFSLEQDAALRPRSFGPPDALSAAASDPVPYRPACDVWLIGHCHTRALSPMSPITTRLAIYRSAQVLIDHSLRAIEGSDVGIAGYGPRRNSALADLEADGVLEIPRGFEWTMLHSAQPSQRVAFLHGDEMLLVEGMLPARPRLRCRVPQVRAAAAIWQRGSKPHDPRHPLDLALDTLGIDSDSGDCVLVWRGYVPIDDDTAPRRMLVAAGLEGEGFPPIDWHEAWVIANAAAMVAMASTSGTLDLADVAPPAHAAPPSSGPLREESTLDIEDPQEQANDPAALPFRSAVEGGSRPPPPAPPKGRPRAATLETIEAPPGARGPATPFEAPAPFDDGKK